MTATILAHGTGGAAGSGSGRVVRWSDRYLDEPSGFRGAVVYDPQTTPLYRAAFVAEHGAAGLMMAEGGRNSHPLILSADAGLPAVAGVGDLRLDGREITVDGDSATVYDGILELPARQPVLPSEGGDVIPVYANVGPLGLVEAARRGASGVGLLRTEFAVARALALSLESELADGRSLQASLLMGNEADVVYAMAENPRTADLLRAAFAESARTAIRSFGQREVLFRTIDLPRSSRDALGNRGIRRDVANGGALIRLLGEALESVLAESGDGAGFGVILPLVSHYSQIRVALDILRDCGLRLHDGGLDPRQIRFGWEIEQPAASQSNRLWLAAFASELGRPPDVIGIGTNDLTQFTLALGRDAAVEEQELRSREYLATLYDELDFSVVRQIVEVAVESAEAGTRVLLLGQAAADPILLPLLAALHILPSVDVGRIEEVRRAAADPAARSAAEAVRRYVERVVAGYPAPARPAVSQELARFFAHLVLPD